MKRLSLLISKRWKYKKTNWEKTIADAILDRIVHDAHRIELRGELLRKNRDKQKNMEIMN